MDDIKTWTGLSVEEPLRMTEEKVNGESTSLVWPTLGSRTAKEQDRTEEMGFISVLIGLLLMKTCIWPGKTSIIAPGPRRSLWVERGPVEKSVLSNDSVWIVCTGLWKSQ